MAATKRSNTGIYMILAGLVGVAVLGVGRAVNRLQITVSNLRIKRNSINLSTVSGTIDLRIFNERNQRLKADRITGTVYINGRNVGNLLRPEPFQINPAGFTVLPINTVLDTGQLFGSGVDIISQLLGGGSRQPMRARITGNVFASGLTFPFDQTVTLT